MRILIAISTPSQSRPDNSGRERQSRATRVATVIRDIATRVEIGAAEGVFERGDIVGSFKIEDVTAPRIAADAA